MLHFLGFLPLAFFLSQKAQRQTKEIYQKYYAVLKRRCFRILRDDIWTEDAMQQVFLTVCKQIDRYRGEHDKILPWLYRIATTHCFRMLEQNKRWDRNIGLMIEEGLENYGENQSSDQAVNKIILESLLSRLPPSVKQVVFYRYCDGMTQEQIATVMEISRDQVRTHLKRFQDSVKKWQQEKNHDG